MTRAFVCVLLPFTVTYLYRLENNNTLNTLMKMSGTFDAFLIMFLFQFFFLLFILLNEQKRVSQLTSTELLAKISTTVNVKSIGELIVSSVVTHSFTWFEQIYIEEWNLMHIQFITSEEITYFKLHFKWISARIVHNKNWFKMHECNDFPSKRNQTSSKLKTVTF